MAMVAVAGNGGGGGGSRALVCPLASVYIVVSLGEVVSIPLLTSVWSIDRPVGQITCSLPVAGEVREIRRDRGDDRSGGTSAMSVGATTCTLALALPRLRTGPPDKRT